MLLIVLLCDIWRGVYDFASVCLSFSSLPWGFVDFQLPPFRFFFSFATFRFNGFLCLLSVSLLFFFLSLLCSVTWEFFLLEAVSRS